jgi:hypothetical protein
VPGDGHAGCGKRSRNKLADKTETAPWTDFTTHVSRAMRKWPRAARRGQSSSSRRWARKLNPVEPSGRT